MGDIADMMLEGELCCVCGEFVGESDNAYPTKCADCAEPEVNICGDCGKEITGKEGFCSHCGSVF